MQTTSPYNTNDGFSLIELILYVAIVSIFITSVIQIGWNIMYGRVKSQVYEEVNYNSRLAAKRITYELRNATGIHAISASDICLASPDAAHNPTRIYVSGDRLHVGWGGGGTDCSGVTNDHPLTSNLVSLSNLQFSDLSDAENSHHVQFSFTIDYNTPGTRQEWERTQTYQSSVEIRSL